MLNVSCHNGVIAVTLNKSDDGRVFGSALLHASERTVKAQVYFPTKEFLDIRYWEEIPLYSLVGLEGICLVSTSLKSVVERNSRLTVAVDNTYTLMPKYYASLFTPKKPHDRRLGDVIQILGAQKKGSLAIINHGNQVSRFDNELMGIKTSKSDFIPTMVKNLSHSPIRDGLVVLPTVGENNFWPLVGALVDIQQISSKGEKSKMSIFDSNKGLGREDFLSIRADYALLKEEMFSSKEEPDVLEILRRIGN